MQLILETETTADLSLKMSTVEESLDTKLKETIETLCNGNKENIENPKNIITNTVDVTDADHKEQSDVQHDLSAQDSTLESEVTNNDHANSTAEDVKVDLEKNSSGEEVASNENSYEKSNNNGINHGNVNGDGQKCQENSLVEENEAEAENVLVNEIVADKTEAISASSKKDTINVDTPSEKLDENEENCKTEDNSNNIDVVDKVLNILDAEIKTDDKKHILDDSIKVLENEASVMLDQVDEDISEMALEVDKTISDMAMQIDEDILKEDLISESIPKETILNDETKSENVSLKSERTPNDVDHIKPNLDVKVLPEKTTVEDIKITDSANELETGISTEQRTADVVESVEKEAISDESVHTVPMKSERNKTETVALSEKTDDEIGDPVPTKPCDAETKDVCDKPEANAPETLVLTEDSVSDSKTEKMDDDVIQIESEQDDAIGETDNEVVDVPENIEDDAQDVVDKDKAVTDVSTSVEIQSSELKPEKIDCDLVPNESIENIDDKVEVLDVDEIQEEPKVGEQIEVPKVDASSKSVNDKSVDVPILKLSNTLDILSDDDEDQLQSEPQKTEEPTPNQKQCINIEDDDDIMLIDEDTDLNKVNKSEPVQPKDTTEKQEDKSGELTIDLDIGETTETKKVDEIVAESEKGPVTVIRDVKSPSEEPKTTELVKETKVEIKEPPKPLLPENFLKSCKKNLADMTREELEEFCILKIVESIVDRSNLGEIKSKLKLLAQNIDEHKKKALMLTKQNRDLQLVLKSVQEEQKKKPDSVITPLKITRSVGMQVLMTEKVGARKKPNTNIIPLAPPSINRNIRTPNQSPRAQKQVGNQQIPVPRLVPAAANPVAKSPMTLNSPINNQIKTPNQFNGARMSPPVQKAEKRPHNRLQSVTVDLTDDEPPAKVTTPRSSPAPPVRLVSPQNLLAAAPRPQVTTGVNSPRKVYIPISGPQGQNIRPGQTIMLKSVAAGVGPRHRSAVPMTRGPAPSIIKRVPANRHPAPLPDAMKQYQPPNWKALPPAPDLKLSKVENGIVISWKIEGYQEDSYEEIASYQLYAYQETSSPPSTTLWKKIGDVKALPLPMACTLTQFMAGFKYYFAVRAVDVRSRLGPFSLPGSILLLNKM